MAWGSAMRASATHRADSNWQLDLIARVMLLVVIFFGVLARLSAPFSFLCVRKRKTFVENDSVGVLERPRFGRCTSLLLNSRARIEFFAAVRDDAAQCSPREERDYSCSLETTRPKEPFLNCDVEQLAFELGGGARLADFCAAPDENFLQLADVKLDLDADVFELVSYHACGVFYI